MAIKEDEPELQLDLYPIDAELKPEEIVIKEVEEPEPVQVKVQ